MTATEILHYVLLALVGLLAGWLFSSAMREGSVSQMLSIIAGWLAAIVLITVMFA